MNNDDELQAEEPLQPEETEEQDGETEHGAEAIVAELNTAVQELESKYLRALADLENLKRRSRDRQEESVAQAKADLLRRLLPVLDNFERALEFKEAGSDQEAFTRGMELIHQQLCEAVSSAGCQAMDTMGQDFDPELHEAVAAAPAHEVPEGRIISEARKGYLLEGKVLRPAAVVVARRPDTAGQEDSE